MKQIVWLACEYGRYGYRRITALLHWEGWRLNHKRVERIWRDEGLKVPKKQPQRRRLWFNDGSCIRLRPTRRDHVWSYCLVADRTSDGRPIRMLTIVDKFTRECLAIDVAKRLTSEDVLERLSDLFVHRGVPEHIRSDNGSEFTAKCVREWLGRVGVKTLFIEPGSPWENGYVESFFRVAPGRAARTGSVRHAARVQGAHRALAAALQHDPAAQRPGVPTPGSRGAAALCGRLGYASATAQGWSAGGQNTNLKSGVIYGGSPGCCEPSRSGARTGFPWLSTCPPSPRSAATAMRSRSLIQMPSDRRTVGRPHRHSVRPAVVGTQHPVVLHLMPSQPSTLIGERQVSHVSLAQRGRPNAVAVTGRRKQFRGAGGLRQWRWATCGSCGRETISPLRNSRDAERCA